MSYTKHAVSGFGWQTVLKGASTLVTLAKIFVLARLLSPADFGLFSLVVIALGLSEATTQTGVNITILQSKRSINYFLDTAWVIAIIRGLVIAILMILMGLLMSKYFAEPSLSWLIAITSLVPLIKGAINPAMVSMQKNFAFFRDSIYRFSLVFVDGLIAVLLGLMLKSVMAMILAMIGAAIFEVAISFIFFKDRPRFHYLPSRAKVIFDNARWLSLSSLLGYLNDNIDDFLIGRILGTYKLGLYHNAYSLSHKANYDVARSIHHGTLPVYTKIRTEKARFKKAFFRSYRASLLLILATSIPLVLFPRLFVEIILGQQWLEVIPLLKWLVLAGFLQGLNLVSYTFFLAQGFYKIINQHQAVSLFLLVTSMVYLANRFGLEGAVIGLAASRLLPLPILIFGIHQRVKKL